MLYLVRLMKLGNMKNELETLKKIETTIRELRQSKEAEIRKITLRNY